MNKCEWQKVYDDYNIWESECGLTWELIDGTPKENNMNYCPNCGKQLIEGFWDEEGANEDNHTR